MSSIGTPGTPVVLSDSSPLQYLYQLGQLSLLPALYAVVTVPEAVTRELATGRRQGVPLPVIEEHPWIRVGPVRHHLVFECDGLGEGEQQVLSVAAEHAGSLAIIDDPLARRVAAELGLCFTGTLGVLLEAKRAGLLPSIRPSIDDLIRLGFRLLPRTRNALLVLANEW